MTIRLSNSGKRHVSLFVPELLSGLSILNNIPKQEIPKLPVTQLLLSRSNKKQSDFNDYIDGVGSLCGIKYSDQQDIPVAAITVAVDKALNSKIESGYIIFAEPVVMRADRDSVVLIESLLSGSSENRLSSDESTKLISKINLHFSDEPWQLNSTKQDDWYFTLSSKYLITTSNLSNVILKNIQPYLPEGDDAKYWRKIINEIEMLLFNCEVNTKRIEQNKSTVSSIWLWGGGKTPQKTKVSNVDVILAENKYTKSIAQFSNIQYKSLKKNSLEEIIETEEFNNVIILNTQLMSHWQSRDIFSWIDELNKIELNLFNLILKYLRDGKIDSVSLYAGNNMEFDLSRYKSKAWWKPIKSLVELSRIL